MKGQIIVISEYLSLSYHCRTPSCSLEIKWIGCVGFAHQQHWILMPSEQAIEGGWRSVSKMLMLLLITAALLEMAHEINNLPILSTHHSWSTDVAELTGGRRVQRCGIMGTIGWYQRCAQGSCPSAVYFCLFHHRPSERASYMWNSLFWWRCLRVRGGARKESQYVRWVEVGREIVFLSLHMVSLRSLLIHIHAGTRWTLRTGPAPPPSANELLAGGEMEVKCLGNSN